MTKSRSMNAKEEAKFREDLRKALDRIPEESYPVILKRIERMVEGVRQRRERIKAEPVGKVNLVRDKRGEP
jgi:hypothetical protein